MPLKELIARAYFYTKLGWGNYIAWWLGAVTYITIIYALVLKAILPAGPLTYGLVFAGLLLLSFLLGFTMKGKGVYGVEHKINTETNPYINIPIGAKEILNYEAQIFQLGFQIEATKIQIEISKALGIDASRLEQLLPRLEEYKARFEEMLKKAVK